MNDQLLVRSINEALKGRLNKSQKLDLRLNGLNQIVRYTVAFISDKENLFFSSYFARISFLANKYGISRKEVYLFHTFRKLFPIGKDYKESHYNLGLYVIRFILKRCLNEDFDFSNKTLDVSSFLLSIENRGDETFKYYEKVFFTKFDENTDSFYANDDQGRSLRVEFNEGEFGKDLSRFISKLDEWKRLPIKAGLFDIKISGDVYRPSYYVLEPDFLIDVTSVSEAFDAFGVSVSGYGLRKLVDKRPTISLHIGNISNVILDELIYDPSLIYDYFINNLFKISTLAFVQFTNEQVRELVDKVKVHYRNIKKVVDEDFKNQGINGRSVFVEPSFYAPRIGIQGRFDLLHHYGDEMNIVKVYL